MAPPLLLLPLSPNKSSAMAKFETNLHWTRGLLLKREFPLKRLGEGRGEQKSP